MTDEPLNVKTAYALQSPQDNKELYADWAKTYDNSFAAAVDYIFPQHVADCFVASGAKGPVLDAGAGTGLVAQAIAQDVDVIIDAFDISPEMLSVAAQKNIYRNLIEGDLTARLPLPDGTYHAVVSAGTFTHGHVGPEAMDELLRVAACGAIFILTIKSEFYLRHGFADKFQSLAGAITGFETKPVLIYGPDADVEHADDQGLIAIFAKA